MTTREYILREKRLMERDCRRKGINPNEWVLRFAKSYHQRYANRVIIPTQ